MYEKLKASLWDWFSPQCNLKPNYIHAKQLGTMVKKNFKNMPILKRIFKTLKYLGCNVAKNDKGRLAICYIYDTTYSLQHDTSFHS